MRGSIGLVIGVALGAGGMYLALRPPWVPRGVVRTSGAPAVVVVGGDAGVTRPKPRKRSRPAGATGQSAAEPGGDADDPAPVRLTAEDRALEWRGDDVVLPPRTVDLASGAGEARALDASEINETIDRQGGGVRDCVVQGATGTDLAATIAVELLVDGRGRVTRSRIQAPRYLLAHGLLGCAQRAVGRLRFPASGAATIVSFPVHLGG